MNIRENLEKIEKEVTPLEIPEYREELVRYEGLLIYNLSNCKDAYEDLREINQQLNRLFSSEDYTDINKIGRSNRVLQDYLILKVRTLFDLDTRTLSFIQLARLLLVNDPAIGKKFVEDLKIIGDVYQKHLDRLSLIANKVVVHHENVKLQTMDTGELLKMPILQLVNALQGLFLGIRA